VATKIIELADIGQITLVKRAGSRNLRLSVTQNGVRVSMPSWTPFAAGHAFALKNIDWIRSELSEHTKTLLVSGQRIGKLHSLRFELVLNGQAITSRVTGTEVVVRLKPNETTSNPAVQKRAHAACLRALKREAEQLLPPRLQGLATTHSRDYSGVQVKQLKRRWGSCDSHQAITLNFFLMELPWEQIDYVLLHELTHTVHMNHGADFWRLLTTMQPRARDIARQVRARQPAIGDALQSQK
jgi:predicted metal-dependent hydrolase